MQCLMRICQLPVHLKQQEAELRRILKKAKHIDKQANAML